MKEVYKYFALFTLLLISANPSMAQILVNNGAQVTVTDNCLVGVLGSFQNGTVGGPTTNAFDNAGYVYIDGDCINLPNHNLTGLDPSSINSVFVVRGDWNNSGLFTAFENTVELDNDIDQAITGTSVTTFHNLYLKGIVPFNVKRQTIDAIVTGDLQVNNSELATDNSNMTVLNSANTAISHNLGFVSSLGDAYLSWRTASTNMYEYPVGSSLGTFRKRVAQLTPGSAAVNEMGVRLANVDATTEDFDRDIREEEICEINPFFYHRIYQISGNDNMDVALAYVPAQDGNWDIMVNWENVPAREWSVTEGSSSNGNFVSVSDWTNFRDTAFAFGRELELALVANPTSICPDEVAVLSITGINGAADLTWISPNDPGLPSGPVVLPLDINVSPAQTTIYIAEVSANGCVITLTDTVVVEDGTALSVSVSPNPAFICQGEDVVFTADTLGGGVSGVVSWFVNGVLQIGENDITFTLVNANDGDVVRADYTTAGGCSGSASSNPALVQTSSGISAEIVGQPDVCVPEGESIPLFVSVDAPNGVDVTITWSSDATLSCYSGCTGTFATLQGADTAYVVVTVTPANNPECPFVDSVLICSQNVPTLYIPTAFTPNSDNDNDVLAILGDIPEFDLEIFRIYNRWGELLFETDNFQTGWDGSFKGKQQELDLYTYYLRAIHTESGIDTEIKGNVTLLR
jgi:gliding motility-associated-like protein